MVWVTNRCSTTPYPVVSEVLRTPSPEPSRIQAEVPSPVSERVLIYAHLQV